MALMMKAVGTSKYRPTSAGLHGAMSRKSVILVYVSMLGFMGPIGWIPASAEEEHALILTVTANGV